MHFIIASYRHPIQCLRSPDVWNDQVFFPFVCLFEFYVRISGGDVSCYLFTRFLLYVLPNVLKM